MKINTLAWLCLLALPLSQLSFAEPNKAPKPQSQKHEQHKVQQQHKINSKQAAAIAQQQYPGKVLSVKRENNQFKVKILHEGNVRYVTVPQ